MLEDEKLIPLDELREEYSLFQRKFSPERLNGLDGLG